MKKLLIIALVLGCCASVGYAQTAKDVAKERKQIAKLSHSELNAKASKAARKEVKKYQKEGWVVAPGQLPLEKQLDRAYNMQYEYDENAYPKYMMDDAMSVGENYDAAKLQALELAKLKLAGQIQTEVVAMVENSVANRQLPNEEAASIAETVMANKSLISQSIGRVIPVVECYRTKKNKNKEVRVMIAYNAKMALESAKAAVRPALEAKSADLHHKLDAIMGL